MPLLDHFHSPLSNRRPWESFHGGWAYEIMAALNRTILPAGYFAAAQVHVGTRIEVDVAKLETAEERAELVGHGSGATAVQTWAPPQTALRMPAVFPDDIEVHIFRSS